MALTNEDLQAIAQLLDTKMEPIKQDMQSVKQDLQMVKQDLQTVKQKVTCIEMTLENEVAVNIMRVAEGHHDLTRNLGDIKRHIESLDGKMEINDLYIRHHDSEIKKLKML